jgi:cytochrome oxidase Cu insertion factor (SCO1/SenC/PrrC family)/thiol-disulfide isomerase/thioredoxin
MAAGLAGVRSASGVQSNEALKPRPQVRTRRQRAIIALAVLAAAVLVSGALASLARADGDPGSDVLVYQPLFAGSDAGLSVNQQVQLGDVLRAAARRGSPIRLAIISSRADLGSVTALWRKPQAYARFLGYELSLAYKQRLLVVMPNGFGFNWPGHSTASGYRELAQIAIKPGGAGLATATRAAVQRLVGLGQGSGPAAKPTGAGAQATAPAPSGSAGQASQAGSGSHQNIDTIVAVVVAVLAVGAVLVALERRRRAGRGGGGARRIAPRISANRLLLTVAVGALALAIIAGVQIIGNGGLGPHSEASDLATNPDLDPGTPLSRAAPDFTLSDQFGHTASLSSYRGKVVLLAFNDSECTTICPLTTTAMLDAKRMLGAAGAQVQLLGVDANPKATSIEDVLSYSQLHGMTHEWRFLTGSLPALKRVWKAYGIQAEIERGLIAHTPALFAIDPQGRLRRLYVTQQTYSAVGQLGQLLAQEASHLLPSHPPVDSHLSYATIPGIGPSTPISLPAAGGGKVRLGPSGAPHLYLFFDTWDQEVTSLAGHLEALNGYRSAAARDHLPPLTAVDEGSVEPSPAALPAFLRTLAQPLSYPVAIDRSGRVADGYEVQGEPWFVLTSASGRILWYQSVDTSGWLSEAALVREARAALTRTPATAASVSGAGAELSGSPAPLAALHQQADRLIGTEPALAARIKALRGYPIVVNAWASWCGPCRSEFGLLASASARYGRSVAFLGADTDDSPSDAQQFLTGHPVSYPSYQTTSGQLHALLAGGLEGLPTTVFIGRDGKVVSVHTGQYDSLGSLEADVQSYAVGG